VNLIADALQVSTGERAPTRSAAAYRAAASVWASTCADEDESPTVALARLCANGSRIVSACYRAAAIASLLDDLDPDELLPADAPDTSARRAAWADLLRLVEPHALPDESLPTALRRVLGDNLAARALLLLLLQEPNQ
jgi:hypothetical protein